VLYGDPAPPRPKRGTAHNFGPCLLWPTGWIDQDGTWYGDRPQPQATLCQLGTQLPLTKKGHSPSPIFGPCLLWANDWMDQDATWYGGRPRPRPHCVTWGLNSAPLIRGTAPPLFGPCLLWPNGWMDQDATWYEGRPRPSLTWRPSSSPKGAQPPIFGQCLLWPNGRPSQLLLSTCFSYLIIRHPVSLVIFVSQRFYALLI